jgi:hypothetical protein
MVRTSLHVRVLPATPKKAFGLQNLKKVRIVGSAKK